MIHGLSAHPVYLVSGITDMRKAINGLSIIISEQLSGNPFSGSVYVFCNRQRNKLKILHWERNGFWLYYRCLEKGKFQWPKAYSMSKASALGIEKEPQTYALTRRELQWLLDGLSITQRQAHQAVTGLSVN